MHTLKTLPTLSFWARVYTSQPFGILIPPKQEILKKLNIQPISYHMASHSQIQRMRVLTSFIQFLQVLLQQTNRKIQYAPLNRIMNNGIKWLIGLNRTRFTSPKLLFYALMCVSSSFIYCYQLVNGISFGLSKVVLLSSIYCITTIEHFVYPLKQLPQPQRMCNPG